MILKISKYQNIKVPCDDLLTDHVEERAGVIQVRRILEVPV